MAAGNDILKLMPEIAAIGYEQLQAYCDEWLTQSRLTTMLMLLGAPLECASNLCR